MVTDEDRAFLRQNNVVICDEFQFFSLECTQDALVFQLELCEQFVGHRFEEDQFALFGLYFGIGQIRIEGNGFISRDRPRCRCPDHEVVIAVQDALAVRYLERQVNGSILDIAVNDLGVRNSRLIVRRPVDRLESLEDQSVQSHLFKCSDLTRFEVFCQCDIRMFIVGDLSQTLFCGHLCGDLSVRVFFALLPEFSRRHGFAVNTQFLDGIFDRQTMRIPAREERCVIAAHCMRTHNEILDHAVHCRAGMQVSVCIRRTVMQDECFLSFMTGDNRIVVIVLFPVFQNTRFLFCQIAAHLKVCLRHPEC